MKVVADGKRHSLTVGEYAPALVLVFELEAEPFAIAGGASRREVDQLVHRLIDDHGPEWGEAFLRVMNEDPDGQPA